MRTFTRPNPPAPRPAAGRAGRLLENHLARPSKRTARAYLADLQALAGFLGKRDATEAVESLLALASPELTRVVEGFVAWMRMGGYSGNTIARRVRSIGALTKRARRLGYSTAILDVQTPKHRAIRDTRGPGAEGFAAMLDKAAGRRDAKGLRDYAALRLLHDRALRAEELLSLDVEHLDLRARRVHVLGKGETDRIWLDLPLETADALARWMAARGPQEGPVFTSGANGRSSARLTYSGLYELITAIGRLAGVRCTPHGLRHRATTAALEATGGDIRAVMQFTRHRCVATVCRYDDDRRSRGGEVAELVAFRSRQPTRS